MTLPPPPSEELKDLLDQLCIQILGNFQYLSLYFFTYNLLKCIYYLILSLAVETRSSGASELSTRYEIKEDLRLFLLQYFRDIDLHLFGSSLNGFGGRSSDIDMCLTFKSNPTGEVRASLLEITLTY